jgi:hypothetical protein
VSLLLTNKRFTSVELLRKLTESTRAVDLTFILKRRLLETISEDARLYEKVSPIRSSKKTETPIKSNQEFLKETIHYHSQKEYNNEKGCDIHVEQVITALFHVLRVDRQDKLASSKPKRSKLILNK